MTSSMCRVITEESIKSSHLRRWRRKMFDNLTDTVNRTYNINRLLINTLTVFAVPATEQKSANTSTIKPWWSVWWSGSCEFWSVPLCSPCPLWSPCRTSLHPLCRWGRAASCRFPKDEGRCETYCSYLLTDRYYSLYSCWYQWQEAANIIFWSKTALHLQSWNVSQLLAGVYNFEWNSLTVISWIHATLWMNCNNFDDRFHNLVNDQIPAELATFWPNFNYPIR